MASADSSGILSRSGASSVSGRSEAGASPGSLVVDPDALAPKISIIGYGPEGECHEAEVENPSELALLRERWPVIWVDVAGLGDIATLETIGRVFGLHPLALEDVVHAWQRPKADPYSDHLFLVGRMPPHDGDEDEQLSLFVGEGWVVTFQERPGDVFGSVRQRIRHRGTGRIRNMGADYLAYALMDALVDSWFPVIDQCALRLEELEIRVISRPGRAFVEQLHRVRRDLLDVLKMVRPLRELLNELQHDESGLVDDEVRIFLRDATDHVALLVESAESQREVAGGLLDMHLSFVSHRMNEIMKVLTIMSALFIPLSFIAGLYGMNFVHMPELQMPWAYPAALLLMASTAGGMLLFFRRRGWIGKRELPGADKG